MVQACFEMAGAGFDMAQAGFDIAWAGLAGCGRVLMQVGQLVYALGQQNAVSINAPWPEFHGRAPACSAYNPVCLTSWSCVRTPGTPSPVCVITTASPLVYPLTRLPAFPFACSCALLARSSLVLMQRSRDQHSAVSIDTTQLVLTQHGQYMARSALTRRGVVVACRLVRSSR